MTLAKKLLMGLGTKSKPYVEFVSSTAMTITPKYTNPGVTLQYSLNGSTWTTIATGVATPSANVIYFRGSATGTKSLYNSTPSTNAWTFTGATNLECNGKLDRLIQDALGSNEDVLKIGDYCFAHMFYNVSSLIYMDSDCLPSTTLATECYYGMFTSCTSLTTAPALPATTLAADCYKSMFQGCTSLITAPALPSTTLATECYQQMFYGCTGLTTAPALPATTLAINCYASMFNRCTKIKLSTTLTGIYDTPYRIPTTGTGTAKAGSIDNMFTATGGSFTGTPTINTTYYTENTPV